MEEKLLAKLDELIDLQNKMVLQNEINEKEMAKKIYELLVSQNKTNELLASLLMYAKLKGH